MQYWFPEGRSSRLDRCVRQRTQSLAAREARECVSMAGLASVSFRSVSFVSSIAIGLLAGTAAAADPFADAVVGYIPGTGVDASYTVPATTLGSPERFTGEGVFPSVVTPFNPVFGTDELVSIGRGGSLTLSFDEPVMNDPSNPFGLDFIIFGNSGLIDSSYPDGVVGGAYSLSSGVIEVSSNGTTWFTLASTQIETAYATLGYSDLSDPFAVSAGNVLSDFTLPVDPSFAIANGLTFPQILSGYNGSGGGTGIDFASTGLSSISFIRISNPTSATSNIQIDAISDVAAIPAPGISALGLIAVVMSGRRSRK